MNLKNYIFLQYILLALSLNLMNADVSQDEEARQIASNYDYRAFRKEKGFNDYQKMEEFFDEYNVRRYKITTLYKNMDINQAYESYVANSRGLHFENQNNISDRCKITKWFPTLPKQSKTLEWHFDFDLACDGVQKNQEWLDVRLSYTYKSPTNLIISYKALGKKDTYLQQPDNAYFILEFTQGEQGTYLKIYSKALPVSFDCKKTNNKTEIAICNIAEKENFKDDIKLYYIYRSLLMETNEFERNRAQQEAWLKKRNQQCQSDIECIKALYKSRYGEISAQLQRIFKQKEAFLEHCASIHQNRWNGSVNPEDFEYSIQRKCSFAGDIFATYEVIKANSQEQGYFKNVEQIMSKKDFEDKIGNDAQGGLAYIDYKWQNNQNTFILSLAYEYHGIIYTLTQKSPNKTEVIVENYHTP